MDRYLLSPEVEAILADTKKGPTCLSNERIAEFTTLHVNAERTAAASVRLWNETYPALPISEQAASKYIRYYHANNKTPYTTAKRGPKELLVDEKAIGVVKTLLKIRDRKIPVDASLVSRVARGLYTRVNGTLSVDISGRKMFSKSWANTFLHKHKFKVLAATGDRTVSGAHVIKVGVPFYKLIAGIKHMDTRLIFNVDEFFCHLENGANNTQSWTWERVVTSKAQNVIIRTDRLGFTCSVLTNCAGEVVLFQIIWKGKTDRVHAKPSAEQFPGHNPHPAVYQTHREDSHFQNETTWKGFLSRFELAVTQIRQELGIPDAPAALIVDAAGQHNDTATFLANSNITTIEVPKKCTHIFQPADMYIISTIKLHAKAGWNRYIETVFREHPVEEAVSVVSDAVIEGRKAMPYKRDLKYSLLCGALHSLSAATVIASWEAAGIRRHLGLAPIEGQHVFYDAVVQIEEITNGLPEEGEIKEGDDKEEEEEVEEEESEDDFREEEEVYQGVVPDPTAPLETNVVHEHLPRTATQDTSPPKRGVGRPKFRPAPVDHKHSLAAFFQSGPKRPREEAIEVEPQTQEAVMEVDEQEQT